MSYAEWSFQDYSREKSRVRFQFQNITAANHDATVALMDDVRDAILGVQVENCQQTYIIVDSSIFNSRAPASNKASQRENKWLLTLADNTTNKVFHHEIPIADLTLCTANSDYMDLSAGDGLALKTAIEAGVKSPAGNAVSLISVQFVGKRL